MPLGDYSTTALLKERLSISDTPDDTMLATIITAVSREIDGWTKRRFYTTVADETRYYTPEFSDVLLPGDIVAVTSLATDADGDRTYETTWATTDYDLEPFNASLDGRPYESLRVTPNGRYRFPVSGGSRMAVTGLGSFFLTSSSAMPARTVTKGVKIVGKFGWSTHPAVVAEACLIQSARLYKRKEAPFGVAGSGEFGQTTFIAKLDPDVKTLLDDVKKRTSLGG